MNAASLASPLAGVRILDLTQFMSGPFATQMLGDLGAEVIKVEPPEGDLSRSIPPHFVEGDSVYYLCLNRNKKSLKLDLKLDRDKAILRRIADRCDIVIENFRPGVAKRLGLDPEALRRERPSLIWCSISGFGQDGPYRDLPAYDIVVQAMSGGMSLTGEREGRPVRSGIPVADLSAGLYAVVGILAALHRRSETGAGETIDISMLDCQVAMLTYQAANVLAGGDRPPPQGRGHASIPTYDAFVAADGIDVVIAANTERMWRDLATTLEVGHLIDDPRFATMGDRNASREALRPLLNEAFLKRSSAEWTALLQAASVPVGAVLPVDLVMADPQVRARGMVLDIEGAGGASVRVAGNPIRLKDTRDLRARYPPPLGADEDDILTWLTGEDTAVAQ